MIERLTTLRKRITDPSSWDAGFIESLTNQANKGYTLSPRQIEILEKIESNWSDEKLRELEEWNLTFNEEKREKYEICLQYYKMTSYFKRQREEYQAAYEDGSMATFIPSMKDYMKIVENKYAQKILDAHYAEPKYTNGSLVVFRKGSAPYWVDRNNMKPMVVVRSNLPVRTAAKGSKRYELLPVGESRLYQCEERHIKHYKKPSKTRSKGV